jgi:pyruvate dehydrogenase E2 component (dihydrolipoamide acetyltransferase)
VIPIGGTNIVARVLRMPGVATDTHEGVLSSWLIEETHSFEAAQTIAYVETSTLLLSVEAGRPGVLLKTLVDPGARVCVGMPIGVIGDRGERVPDLEALLAELGVNGHAEASRAPAPLAPELPEPAPTASPAAVSPKPEVSATEEHEEPAFEPEPEEPAPGHRASEPTPASEPRLTHDHLRTTVRAERLVALAAVAGSPGVTVTVEHLVVRAVAGAHRQLPELNLTRGPDGVRREDSVDVSLAIGTPDGPVAPVVRDVAARSLHDLARLMAELTTEARSGRLVTGDRGGSIAISHLGRYGLDDSVPSVAPPQVASLAVGAVRDEPVVEGGAIVAGKTLTLTLSVDHALVDDVLAARWLGVVAALLERPEWMHD